MTPPLYTSRLYTAPNTVSGPTVYVPAGVTVVIRDIRIYQRSYFPADTFIVYSPSDGVVFAQLQSVLDGALYSEAASIVLGQLSTLTCGSELGEMHADCTLSGWWLEGVSPGPLPT